MAKSHRSILNKQTITFGLAVLGALAVVGGASYTAQHNAGSANPVTGFAGGKFDNGTNQNYTVLVGAGDIGFDTVTSTTRDKKAISNIVRNKVINHFFPFPPLAIGSKIADEISKGDKRLRNNQGAVQTRELIQSVLDQNQGQHDVHIFTTGDNVYNDYKSLIKRARGKKPNEYKSFLTKFETTWGQLQFHFSGANFSNRVHPAVGNHDDEDISAYFSYFGTSSSDSSQTVHKDIASDSLGTAETPWYSYNPNSTWHVVVLDSECDSKQVGGCGPDSKQVTWLKQDLAQNSDKCIIADWHRPRLNSTKKVLGPAEWQEDQQVQPFWDALQAAHADLILNGHAHNYQQFAPMVAKYDENGKQVSFEQSADGIREFVVGTGGATRYAVKKKDGNKNEFREVAIDDTLGVLELDLFDKSYSWRFIPAKAQFQYYSDDGKGPTSEGRGATDDPNRVQCHNRAATTAAVPPAPQPNANVTRLPDSPTANDNVSLDGYLVDSSGKTTQLSSDDENYFTLKTADVSAKGAKVEIKVTLSGRFAQKQDGKPALPIIIEPVGNALVDEKGKPVIYDNRTDTSGVIVGTAQKWPIEYAAVVPTANDPKAPPPKVSPYLTDPNPAIDNTGDYIEPDDNVYDRIAFDIDNSVSLTAEVTGHPELKPDSNNVLTVDKDSTVKITGVPAADDSHHYSLYQDDKEVKTNPLTLDKVTADTTITAKSTDSANKGTVLATLKITTKKSDIQVHIEGTATYKDAEGKDHTVKDQNGTIAVPKGTDVQVTWTKPDFAIEVHEVQTKDGQDSDTRQAGPFTVNNVAGTVTVRADMMEAKGDKDSGDTVGKLVITVASQNVSIEGFTVDPQKASVNQPLTLTWQTSLDPNASDQTPFTLWVSKDGKTTTGPITGKPTTSSDGKQTVYTASTNFASLALGQNIDAKAGDYELILGIPNGSSKSQPKTLTIQPQPATIVAQAVATSLCIPSQDADFWCPADSSITLNVGNIDFYMDTVGTSGSWPVVKFGHGIDGMTATLIDTADNSEVCHTTTARVNNPDQAKQQGIAVFSNTDPQNKDCYGHIDPNKSYAIRFATAGLTHIYFIQNSNDGGASVTVSAGKPQATTDTTSPQRFEVAVRPVMLGTVTSSTGTIQVNPPVGICFRYGTGGKGCQAWRPENNKPYYAFHFFLDADKLRANNFQVTINDKYDSQGRHFAQGDSITRPVTQVAPFVPLSLTLTGKSH